MVIYYLEIEIPMLCFGIILWIICCHLAKKCREMERRRPRPTGSPSVYVIPIYEGEEHQYEEVTGIYDPYLQPPYRDPPVYTSRNVSPPPYRLEPLSYPDPPPSYTDPPPSYTAYPPAYSQQP